MAATLTAKKQKPKQPINKVSKAKSKPKAIKEAKIKAPKKPESRAFLKESAFDLYINTDYNQKRIAEILGVTEKTITAWKTLGNWEEIKAAGEMSSQKIIKNIYTKMAAATEEDARLNADELIKLAKVIESLSNQKTTISQIINVFKDFTTFLFTINPEMAKEVNIAQQKYITKLLQE